MNKNIFLRYGYLMYPVTLRVIPEIEINNLKYFSKRKYHVSLIRLCDYSKDQQKRIHKFAQTFTKKYPIKIKKLTHTFRTVTENDQKSIIIRVEMAGLKRLISAVNQQFGYKIVYPPTHVTLFTLKDQYGIGIDTRSRYRLLTQEINSENSNKLLKSILNNPSL